jgi:hypothetical protein
MNVVQLLRLLTRLCELESKDLADVSAWQCGPHRFTAPLPRDRGNSQSLWRMDGVALQRMSWLELMRVAGHVAECV